MENKVIANIGNRIVAYLIDAAILGGIAGVIFVASIAIGIGANTGGSSSAGGVFAIIFGVLFIYVIYPLGFLLYFTFMEASEKQATIGKSVMKIKVVNSYGERMSTSESFMRNFLGRLISMFTCGIGLFMALFTENNQGLHDMIGKTYVVEATETINEIE
jgi:uncharacterized RDD family membrane protein YckC